MRAAALRFITEAPDMGQPSELLEALHLIARKHRPQPLGLFATWRLPPRSSAMYATHFELHQINRTLFFGPDVAGGKYWAQYLKYAAAYGRSALNDYGRNANSAFTLTEAMLALGLTGNGRWVFLQLRRFGARDGLYCPYRRWAVLFGSDRPLDVGTTDRQMLMMAGNIATSHLERLSIKSQRTAKEGKPLLTARQLEILRLRAAGKKHADIAVIVGIKPLTARNHLDNILKVLKASDMVDAVMKAVRLGLLLSAP